MNNKILNSSFLRFVSPFAAQLTAILAIFLFSLRILSLDLSFNLADHGDVIWFSVPIKSMVDNGWVYTVPQLSAPFELSVAAFPSMTHTDWLVMKIISLFTPKPELVLNVFWLFSIVFTAWSATFAMYVIGVRMWLAAVVGLVYAFLPFALWRNVAHISLVYYCVPLLSLLAIWIAQGCDQKKSKLICGLGCFSLIAQGFDYIYYSFFSILLFGFAGWYGAVQARSWRPIKAAAISSLVILVISSINLVPSFLSWHTNGKPSDMDYKTVREVEVFGLKIRKMLAPHTANEIPFLRQWAQKDTSAGFPNENENVSARLGPMAAVGLLFIIMVSLGLVRVRDDRELEVIKPIAALTIFGVLFATVGGLGALFNLTFAQFRTYNRFSVFIAFFALSAIALWWQSAYRHALSGTRKFLFFVGLVMLVVLSFYDQLLDFKMFHNVDQRQTAEIRSFVEKIEGFAHGASVFQLPITTFPSDVVRGRLKEYDHGKAYLASSSLHWSWPSFSQRHSTWQDRVKVLEGVEFLEALALSNFRLIWIDRFGYADEGQKIFSSLVAAGAKEIFPGESPRFAILDLDDVTIRLRQRIGEKEFERRKFDLLNAPAVSWEGFYAQEQTPKGVLFRWSDKNSKIRIRNFENFSRSFSLSFSAASEKTGTLTVMAGDRKLSSPVSGNPFFINLPLEIGAEKEVVVSFSIDSQMIDRPPGETRNLYFNVSDVQLKPIENSNH